jgi:hypothetical protein
LRKRIDGQCPNGCRQCWTLRRIHSDEVSVGREPSMAFSRRCGDVI